MSEMETQRKEVNFEEAVKVPWLMRVPWLSKEQTIKERPVSQIDMIPTLLDLMGEDIPETMPGHSLKPYMMGGKPAENMVFIEESLPVIDEDEVNPPNVDDDLEANEANEVQQEDK